MNEILQEMVAAYAGQSAEEIHADMVSAGADNLFADPWLTANYLAHLASGG